MRKAAPFILLIAVALTAWAYVHELIHEPPSIPYTFADYAFDILIVGTYYVGFIFAVLFVLYSGIRSIFTLLKKL